MLELVNEGNLIPTAQQVSDRAGVGIRSVFRHFSDMESLYQVLGEQTAKESRSYFIGGDREGTLEERIATMLDDKRELADTVVGGGEGWATELDDDALRRLVALADEP